jgi:hypothetical protein
MFVPVINSLSAFVVDGDIMPEPNLGISVSPAFCDKPPGGRRVWPFRATLPISGATVAQA